MTIDQLAHEAGIPTSTVRLYTEQRADPSLAAAGPDGLLKHRAP